MELKMKCLFVDDSENADYRMIYNYKNKFNDVDRYDWIIVKDVDDVIKSMNEYKHNIYYMSIYNLYKSADELYNKIIDYFSEDENIINVDMMLVGSHDYEYNDEGAGGIIVKKLIRYGEYRNKFMYKNKWLRDILLRKRQGLRGHKYLEYYFDNCIDINYSGGN
jgi:hypothetical protein